MASGSSQWYRKISNCESTPLGVNICGKQYDVLVGSYGNGGWLNVSVVKTCPFLPIIVFLDIKSLGLGFSDQGRKGSSYPLCSRDDIRQLVVSVSRVHPPTSFSVQSERIFACSF